MPELPEVETIKRVIEPQIQGRSIENIFIRQPAVIAHPATEEFHSQLIGQIISRMERRGKFFSFSAGQRRSHDPASAYDRLPSADISGSPGRAPYPPYIPINRRQTAALFRYPPIRPVLVPEKRRNRYLQRNQEAGKRTL